MYVQQACWSELRLKIMMVLFVKGIFFFVTGSSNPCVLAKQEEIQLESE